MFHWDMLWGKSHFRCRGNMLYHPQGPLSRSAMPTSHSGAERYARMLCGNVWLSILHYYMVLSSNGWVRRIWQNVRISWMWRTQMKLMTNQGWWNIHHHLLQTWYSRNLDPIIFFLRAWGGKEYSTLKRSKLAGWLAGGLLVTQREWDRKQESHW